MQNGDGEKNMREEHIEIMQGKETASRKGDAFWIR